VVAGPATPSIVPVYRRFAFRATWSAATRDEPNEAADAGKASATTRIAAAAGRTSWISDAGADPLNG
jgi:hypothetical protein